MNNKLKDKIIFMIWYLISKKTLIYSAIVLIALIMWYIWTNNYITYKITVAEHDRKVQEFIVSKEKELKPLETQANELKLKIQPLKSCIEGVKKTLGTTEIFNCNKVTSIIPKANADEYNTWLIINTPIAKLEDKLLDRDWILMKRICQYWKLNWKVSPLCNNWQLYDSMKWISEAYKIPFSIALGITFAESHIWVNYAWTCDSTYNNWWWVKWRIWSDWKAIKDQIIPQNWCWVYKFGSVEDYWQSKMRTLQKYKSCFSKDKPITCISYAYVWNANVAEQSWISRVALISE